MVSRKTDWVPLLLILGCLALIFWGLGAAKVPLLIATFLTYLLLPIAKRLEERGIPRVFAVAVAILLSSILGVALVGVVIPILVEDLKMFVAALPGIAEDSIRHLQSFAAGLGVDLAVDQAEFTEKARAALGEIPIDALKFFGTSFGRAFSGAVGVLLSILNLLLIPIFFFHLMMDSDRLVGSARALIPPRHRRWFDSVLARANDIIGAYFRGQLLVAIVLGLLYGTGFWAVGTPFGFLIGLLTGFLNVIPYAGPLIGLSLATAVALANFDGYGSLLGVWAVFAVVQGLESFVITPKIVGDRVGLNALETMLSLIIGGNLGGFVGMLVAVPVAGIAKMIFLETRRAYFESSLYTGR